MHLTVQIIAWLTALAWLSRTVEALIGFPRIPNLNLPQHDLPATASLTVIVPACNEQTDIAACLQSLLDQDLPNLRIIAVNDRSSDQTGPTIHALATAHPAKLSALHVAALPAGWLGKTHAMAHAAAHAITHHAPEFLLFTDADILFRPDALRRTLAHAQSTRADHLVLLPTTLVRRWDEAPLLSFFPVLALWGARPWRVQDPRARDAVGIGAFNLLRTSAYQQLGGFKALRMEIVEDLALALRVKALGLRQRLALAPGLVSVYWAAGARGIVNGMTKNLFAAVRFNILLGLLGCLWMSLFFTAPFIAIWLPRFTLPAALAILSIAVLYALTSRATTISPANALLAPFAALAFIYTMLRSIFITLRHGGVEWRGTFYPLAALRHKKDDVSS